MFKKGQKVTGKTTRGYDISGTVVATRQTSKGEWVEVDCGRKSTISTRPSLLKLA